MVKHFIRAHPQGRLDRRQRVVACFLLVMVVLLLVVNPLWESHDHMDNLRHLGPNGVLVMFLLFACAGITLLKSLAWRRPSESQILRGSLRLFAPRWLEEFARLRSIFSSDLLLPLRI